ncbi:MAG: DNA/RNA nuclease SfsA [Syntrophales bacterium]|nr:DNA/RNA nuclease SfsA [Syntrophales bacterium]MDY0044215.1 DNA/RNA nuclease SfsA [Syntrophales bacterium]
MQNIFSEGQRFKPFKHLYPGLFNRRLNRFLIECTLLNRICYAYLPNPGRLRELLLPGSMIYLIKNSTGKYPYTAVAVERSGRPVLLHTHVANQAVKWLLAHNAIPGLEDVTIVRSEVAIDHSRFDFLLEKEGKPFILEVKSCSLFEENIALFPDAVTERGRRHLLELAQKAGQGIAGGVVFLTGWPQARYFLPDYHNDLNFARTLFEIKEDILVKPVAVEWKEDLSLAPCSRELIIPWKLVEREAQDCGSYILILTLTHDTFIETGKLGVQLFRKGYYLYVGSAKKNLNRRISRHLRKRKKFHWHIDYLRDLSDFVSALPVRSHESLECRIAKALEAFAHWEIPGFGSSDCHCRTHLFGMKNDPFENPSFIKLIQYFRIGRLGEQLREHQNNELP